MFFVIFDSSCEQVTVLGIQQFLRMHSDVASF